MTAGRGSDREYWDAAAAGWGAGRQRLWRAHSDAVNRRLLESWLIGGVGRVLKTDAFDEAMGEGLLPALAPRATRLVAQDLSPVVLRRAVDRCPGLVGVVADARALPFGGDAFDTVVSISTLDHFESVDELRLALAELGRILKPSGRLVVTLDNPANPLVAVRNALPFRLLRLLRLVPYRVGATVGRRRLERLLVEVGFRVHAVEAVLHCPRVAAVAAAAPLGRVRRESVARLFLRWLMGWERLRRWPTRFATGHFVAALAVREGP